MALGEEALVIELPGHGDSDWREDFDYDPATMAAPVASAMRQSSPLPQVLAGHSLGGMTAIAVAARYPDQVSRLVLIDMSPGRSASPSAARAFIAGPESYGSREEVMDRAIEHGLGPSREALTRGVFLNTRVRPDGRVVFKHHLANPPEGTTIPALDFAAYWPQLESLRVPVLLVRATRGVLEPEREKEFLERVPDGRVVTVDTGHNVQHERPVELASIIQQFSHPH